MDCFMGGLPFGSNDAISAFKKSFGCMYAARCNYETAGIFGL